MKACCVLHNMCIDWGLRKLPPGQNKDPDHERDIRIDAQRLLNKHNPDIDIDRGGLPRGLWSHPPRPPSSSAVHLQPLQGPPSPVSTGTTPPKTWRSQTRPLAWTWSRNCGHFTVWPQYILTARDRSESSQFILSIHFEYL